MLKKVIEELAWGFNGTKFGDKCWAIYEKLRERELRKADRRKYK